MTAPPASAVYASVAVDAPLPEALTYAVPPDLPDLRRGQSVTVPLGSRQVAGLVLRTFAEAPVGVDPSKLKNISAAAAERPCVPGPYVDWVEWLAQYYVFPVGQIAATLFPPLPKKSKRAGRKAPVVKEFASPSAAPELTDEQAAVLRSIGAARGFGVHLLHGVTGSGKTEVYLDLLAKTRADGRAGLVLVPEIALTPQLVDRFSRRFPGEVGVLHSHLTPREKTNQWWAMVSGQKHILIGARSALFCPVGDLGLIVLDEEHEPSYKQDEHLKYHARDAAIVLARNFDVPIVLGSATPSLESWSNARAGKFNLHRMARRVHGRAFPAIEVVDLRVENARRKDEPSALPYWLSDRLHAELGATFAAGDQAALFLNRRGVAQTAQCRACGFVSPCPNCSVSLTVHGRAHLVCHYCGYDQRLTELCPACKAAPLEPLGLGTEKIEADMARLFPAARIARADRDEVQTREQLERLVAAVEAREVDLLIGTQMIAKGLDFPHLNLVGLVLADVGFHWPDFRAGERSYQLITQVSGRSGRLNPGKVVIQTYDPAHPSVRGTVDGDYEVFANSELDERRLLNYPPAWRMAMFRVQGASASEAERTAEALAARAEGLRGRFARFRDGTRVLGPAEAPLFKLRNVFRYQVIVKGETPALLNSFCRRVLGRREWVSKRTKVQVDIDPFQML